ncbi:MAG: NAD(P)-binding protein [Nitrospira sp.]|nr:NAD(P)-binding protein [Nitrospira sp.]
MTTPVEQTVLVLGAGLTGLAVAHFLNRQGYRVTLLDHPDWQDSYGMNPTDAAPVLFGRHQATWLLLRSIESTIPSQPDRTVPLEFLLPTGRIAAYQATHLPGALQWMTSLFSFHGLSWHDRWTLFSHLEQIWEQAESLPADLDNRLANEWLTSIGQSQEARQCIWNPLILWLTGNELGCLSAAMFVRQLSTLFLGRTMDARLTFLHGLVTDRFLGPLKEAVQRQHAQILTSSLSPELRFGPDGVTGVRLQDGPVLQAQWYVAALSHRTLLPLLPERLLTRYAYFAQISELETLPQTTVQFARRSTTASPRLLLLADRPFHYLTVAPCGAGEIRYRLSAIGSPALMELEDEQLTNLGLAELRLLAPKISQEEIHSVEIDRRSHAALSLKPGAALLRPIQQSPVGNLLIAGAWTDTGWPANIESAVVSAQRCAEIISGSRLGQV